MWLDGRKGWLSYWSSNEPNSAKETCAVANFDPGYQRRWEDWDCTRKTAFVCFSDSKHVVKLKLVRNSYLDLNDSTLQEELLQQLQQKLIDQEGKENLKLSWKKRPDGNVFYPERKEDGF
ncbi:layilin-like [Xiphophorus maculatus]|uniref:layilin-like n=1 Tax=Xiphophorus maculatus TaxID=8083 RepID=UPI000C6CBC41|nr:layilin-like [Xiphophorus maculatus]